MPITNFGGNLSYHPAHYYEPETEAEVLDILRRHAGGTVRVVASGHSWSAAIETPDTAIRLDALDEIEIRHEEDGGVVVRAGAGATLHDLVRAVESETDHTFPTLGGITRQTISGAISTGTHGSGRSSLSHYVEEIRVAAYGPESGEPRVYTYTDGDGLRAARCSVGRMGVVLSVTFRAVPKYLVSETIREVDSVEALLERDREDSLEQAILLPYSWRLLVFDRTVVHRALSLQERARAAVFSMLSLLYIDVALHLFIVGVLLAVRTGIGGRELVPTVYRTVIPRAIPRDVTHTGPSTDVLTLGHDLFRHEEMELFVPKEHLVRSTALVTHVVAVVAGEDSPAASEGVLDVLREAGTADELERLRGRYIHHYPLFFRRVLPDDTLVSMASDDDEPYYSLSFFTYDPPDSRGPFYELCHVVAKTLAVAFDARPHWGKHNPLRYEDVEHLYPEMAEFHRQVRTVDPGGTFSNEYTRRALGI